MLKHLKRDYLGIMHHRVLEGSKIDLLLSRPMAPGESDSSPSAEPAGSGPGQSASSDVKAVAPVKNAPVDSGVHLLKDGDGNEAGLALGTRSEADDMAASIQRGPNSRGGVHVVEEAARSTTEVPGHSPTSVAPSAEEPTSPAEGSLELDQPEVTGVTGEQVEVQPAVGAVEPEGAEAATVALNVSVASGAVVTPTGAAVVATEPVQEERDSLPDFSEEERAPR